MTRLVHIGIAWLLVTACGGSGPSFGPETAPTQTQETAITKTAQSLTQLAQVDTQGAGVAGAALMLATTSQALITTSSGAKLDRSPGEPRPAAAPPPGRADCAVVSSTSIVWDHCTEQGYTIDGMISWSPGHVETNVHAIYSDGTYSFDYTLTGSMTVSSTAIQGDMTLAMTVDYAGNGYSMMVHSQIDVAISDGCISSGTLTVTESGTGTGSVNGAVQVIWTSCGEFRVRNA